MTSDYVEGWFRRDAVLSAAHHSYNTMRLSPLRTLLDLERERVEGGLSPAQIVRYHVYRASLAQMRAITFQYSSDVYRKMANNQVMTLLINAERRAQRHRKIAAGSRIKFATELALVGAGYEDARALLRRSINAEQYGGVQR